MSSRSILFYRGRFQGWNVSIHGDTVDGRIVRTLMQLETPGRRAGERLAGMLSFAPGIPGFEETSVALTGGVPELERALEWVIEATAKELRSGINGDEHRAYWQRIVDAADHSRATWYAECAEVAAFQVVGRVLVAV